MLSCLEARGLGAQWKRIGVFLKLPYPDMDVIEKDRTGVQDRLMAMVYQWLTTGTATKKALGDVLKTFK